MSRVLTNNVTLQYTVETSIGVLPGSPLWRELEPNNISAFGASITTVSRRPIARERGRKKGAVTNRESAVEFDADLTMSSMEDFAEGFVFSEFANVEFNLQDGTGTIPPPAVDTTDDFTVDSVSALLGGKMVYVAAAARSLVFAKGYTNSVNNGFHVLSDDTAPSDVKIQVGTSLVSETPPTNATLEVAGVRIGDSDLTFTVSGSTATLVSSADVANWATLGLLPGQYIHIGGATSAAVVQNALKDSTTDDTFGYARITSIATATLNLDKLDTNLGATADNTSEGDCDILYGRFLRNVATSAATDDERYLERSYQVEALFPDLGGAGNDEYEYAIGNFANELALNFPLTDKATGTWGFIGTNSDEITSSRKTGASTGTAPIRTTALNTSSDIISLTTDVVSSVSDVCFKSLTLTIRNNVTPENCLGTLGATFVNAGLFEVNLDGQMLFTTKEIVNAIAANDTVTFAAILANTDGAFAIDLPSMTFGGGDREYPVDQSVAVNITGETFNDPDGTIPNVSIGISLFPRVPLSS